jgi:hypothetical protein
VAETLDWTQALVTLGQGSLEPEVVTQTIGCLLKDRHDLGALTESDLAALVAAAQQEPA